MHVMNYGTKIIIHIKHHWWYWYHNKSSLNNENLKEIKLNKKIKLLGKSNEMKEIYKKMDIVILPSGEKVYLNLY